MNSLADNQQVSPLDDRGVRIDGQQMHGESAFPYVVECSSNDCMLDRAVRWVAEQSETLLAMATSHGAVLFCGFPVQRAEDFDALISALPIVNFPYGESLSNAVRVNRTDRVFSANEAPPAVGIFLHHEMAQTPLYPRWILFSCEIAAEQGGATPICRSDLLYEQLVRDCPEFVVTCEMKGLLYTNVMPDADDARSGMGRSWRSTLGVDSRIAAEERLRSLGYTWEWLGDGCLKATTPPLPAIMEVSPGRKTFFNQLIAAYSGWKDSRNDPSQAVRHADGSILDEKAVARAIELADELTFDVSWQAGDVVLIDNTITMHARRPFVGTRKVLASLADMQAQTFEVAG
jgi:hypothetical protein